MLVVLIYPYWNVNVGSGRFGTGYRIVLIYPYWNVNWVEPDIEPTDFVVLIYPYWNVNRKNRAAVHGSVAF